MSKKKIAGRLILGTGVIVLSVAAISASNSRQAAQDNAEQAKATQQALVINSGKTKLQAAQDTAELQVQKTNNVCKWAGTVVQTSKVPKYQVPAECLQQTVSPQ